ncbi:MAG TPA: 50S ribosomal protein L4 [candidate division Zixibacteria bacterium]|jgi:large subunit ribosomal protein L4|nr:50S ribosomal protein L4 [candidate division Zixibacteria bacterium]
MSKATHMPEVSQYDSAGKKTGTLELPREIFGAEANRHLLYLAVRQHLDSRRQGTASTQNAADVRGGGKKPFPQKSTGRARQGSRRSSIQVGGYVAHGPHPRDYSWNLPRKQRRAALVSALSDSAVSGKLSVIESLKSGGKTKEMHAVLAAMGLEGKKVIFLDGAASPEILRAARNIPGLHVKPARQVHPYDLLWSDMAVITESGLKSLKEALSR